MDRMKRISITTLGCKVNQCESAALTSLFVSDGSIVEPDMLQSDVIVINTCAVTSKAAMQSRQAIRKAIRRNPDAKIIVTGCYAQTAPEQIKTIKGVDLIVGHADKMRIAKYIAPQPKETHSPRLIWQPINGATQFDAMPSVTPENRTRAFLKIQDGCNAFCTYCIVPYARGRSRSMPFTDVIKHIEKLTAEGFQEVVLTGIHLGVYGKDLEPSTTLEKLLFHLALHTGMKRIRISSIEPTDIEAPLIELMADPRSCLCPHLHIPLQSGDNQILHRMGRPYTRNFFSEMLNKVHRHLPHAAIGVDVMAGFPGESEAAFERSYGLIQELPVTYLHVFPFSPRKGTPAEKFDHRVGDSTIKARCQRLRRLGEEKKKAFFTSQIGSMTNVLIESATDSQTSHAKGLSDNYIPVSIPNTGATENTVVKVKLMEVNPDWTVIAEQVT
jgi:threonylcarbamoyladenosine tRNA methylthiotransferase MtaB